MKNRRPLYHILFWVGLYLLWILIFRSYAVSLSKTMTIEFCYLLFITANYYIITYIIIPKFLQKRKYFWFAFTSMLLIAFSALLRALLAAQMSIQFFNPNQPVDFGTLYFNSFVNILIWVQLITIGKMILDRRQNQQQLETLEKERAKSELDFLKAQINPHALFNSLNTIYGYIDKNNQAARNVLLQFSELLRYQLYDCSVERISMAKEVEYIEKYTAFQQLRKEKNLQVELEMKEIEDGLEIVPLLLVVLIENAFKFVSNSTDHENKITIRLFTKEKILYGYFSNTKEPHRAASLENTGGIGIANLQRRLALSYPGKHELTTKETDHLYETTLTIHLS
ncbi:MAG TPA: histidine kinase [Cytophagaceae bacterium]|nr:histidine kinase [Cytophagaceae bacterium]